MKKELIDYGKELGISDPEKLDANGVLVLEASFAEFNKPSKLELKPDDKQEIDFTAQMNISPRLSTQSRDAQNFRDKC